MMRRFVILPVLALGLMLAPTPAQASPMPSVNVMDAPHTLSMGVGELRQSKGEKRPKPRKPGPQGEPDGDD